jgi:hypothetical protein
MQPETHHRGAAGPPDPAGWQVLGGLGMIRVVTESLCCI